VVSYEVIWCNWVRSFPSNEGTPLRNRYFTTIGSCSVKRLQIDTYLLLIITSTADELSEGTSVDDLKRPPK